MANLRPRVNDSVVIVIDLQPAFLKVIEGAEGVLSRTSFLAEVAKLLGVPVLATEQVPSKMGGTTPELAALMGTSPIAKDAFGCCESVEFMDALKRQGRSKVLLVGIETHICVGLTAAGLVEAGYQVGFCVDAVGSRSLAMSQAGIDRMSAAGAAPLHTESVVYEWLQTASHPRFREAVAIVKRFA